MPDGAARKAVRKQPKVAAAGNRPVAAEEAHRRSRDLDDLPAGALDLHREAAEMGDAVDVVPDRKDAGVVAEALFDQYVECPQRAFQQRVTGGAETAGGRGRPGLEEGLAAHDVGAELPRVLPIHQLIRVIMD